MTPNRNRKPNPNPRSRPRPTPPPRGRNDWFFGWNNTKWFIREIGKIYSSQPSYFSKKRIESGFSFIVGQIGMIMFLMFKYQDLSMYDFILWASLEFAVGGYVTWQIQRQKRVYGYDQGYGNGYGYDQGYGNGYDSGGYDNGYGNGYDQPQYNGGRPQEDQNGQDPEPTPPPPDAGRTSYPT